MTHSQMDVRPQMHWHAVTDSVGGTRLVASWYVDSTAPVAGSHAA